MDLRVKTIINGVFIFLAVYRGRGKSETQRAGANGMSAEQVLRCMIIKAQ